MADRNIKPKRGPGRPPGMPQKVSSAAVRRAMQSGPLPPENLLTLGRVAMGMVTRYQPRPDNVEANMAEFKEWFRIAIDANNKAAPYFSFRLAAMKHVHQHVDLNKLSDHELTELEKIVERASVSGGNPDREGSSLN